ncbi:hypothetical protein EVAR_72269_1 [Eumeta japonica]|uniref:Uncharacterized protein n=1 Tax=Eumeta variegata TaxID=151549 RepID=A0A4C1TAE0_EUMVA|nr:hypothetical protein EVAR_72269_1 [Eumeta japonica]
MNLDIPIVVSSKTNNLNHVHGETDGRRGAQGAGPGRAETNQRLKDLRVRPRPLAIHARAAAAWRTRRRRVDTTIFPIKTLIVSGMPIEYN